MNIFTKIRNGRLFKDDLRAQVSSRTIDQAIIYAEELELPRAGAPIEIWLADAYDIETDVESANYILIRTKAGEAGRLNVGYVAGQIRAFFRFQGISSRILDHPPTQNGSGMTDTVCAAVEFGTSNHFPKEQQHTAKNTLQGVCSDPGENWIDEVLEQAKHDFYLRTGKVQIEKKEGCICFVPKSLSGRRRERSELETGIAVANVMAAAEELWVELQMKTDALNPRMVCLSR